MCLTISSFFFFVNSFIMFALLWFSAPVGHNFLLSQLCSVFILFSVSVQPSHKMYSIDLCSWISLFCVSLSTAFHLMYFKRKYLLCLQHVSLSATREHRRCIVFFLFNCKRYITQHLFRRFYPCFYCFIFCRSLTIAIHRQWFLPVKI